MLCRLYAYENRRAKFSLPLFLDTLAEYIFEPTGVISHIKRAIVRDFKKESMMGFEALFPFSIPKSVLKGL